MSNAARVAKLEQLLARIERNRRPRPRPVQVAKAPSTADLAAPESPTIPTAPKAATPREPVAPTTAATPVAPAPIATPVAPPPIATPVAPAPIATPVAPPPPSDDFDLTDFEPPAEPPKPADVAEPTTGERAKAPKPTPMEMALEVELENRPESMDDVEIEVEEGPEVTIEDDEDLIEATPTAPVELRAPELASTPAPAPRVSMPEPAPRVSTPALDLRAPERAPAREPLIPRPIETVAAKPSAPIARVTSRAPRTEPATFGELLDRALALRPR